MIKIQRANANTIKEAYELVKLLAINEGENDNQVLDYASFKEYVLSDRPSFYLFVAYDSENNKVCGIALYYYRFSSWKLGKYIFLEDFFVLPSYRNNGVGKLLYTHLIQQAKEENICCIGLEVRQDNPEAIKFYQRHGAYICENLRVCLTKIQ